LEEEEEAEEEDTLCQSVYVLHSDLSIWNKAELSVLVRIITR
jgi:hypothetical protein